MFEKKFKEIELIEEPFLDLKTKQKELMSKWEDNENYILNLRKSVK